MRRQKTVETPESPAGAESEVTILVRVLGNEQGLLPPAQARYVLKLGFSERDKARMHDLAEHNQVGTLSLAEQEELGGFAKAGCLLGILQSKARRSLKNNSKKTGREDAHG